MEKNNKTKKQNEKTSERSDKKTISYKTVLKYKEQIEKSKTNIEKFKLLYELIDKIDKSYGKSIFNQSFNPKYELIELTHKDKLKQIMIEGFNQIVIDIEHNNNGQLITSQKQYSLIFREKTQQKTFSYFKSGKNVSQIGFTKRKNPKTEITDTIDTKAKWIYSFSNKSEGKIPLPNIFNKKIFDQIKKYGLITIRDNREKNRLIQLIEKESKLISKTETSEYV